MCSCGGEDSEYLGLCLCVTIVSTRMAFMDESIMIACQIFFYAQGAML